MTWKFRTRRPPGRAARSASSAWARRIDAESTAVFFWRYRHVQGWERDVWRFLYKTKLEDRHWAVLEQDRMMLEAMASDADQAENLYSTTWAWCGRAASTTAWPSSRPTSSAAELADVPLRSGGLHI